MMKEIRNLAIVITATTFVGITLSLIFIHASDDKVGIIVLLIFTIFLLAPLPRLYTSSRRNAKWYSRALLVSTFLLAISPLCWKIGSPVEDERYRTLFLYTGAVGACGIIGIIIYAIILTPIYILPGFRRSIRDDIIFEANKPEDQQEQKAIKEIRKSFANLQAMIEEQRNIMNASLALLTEKIQSEQANLEEVQRGSSTGRKGKK